MEKIERKYKLKPIEELEDAFFEFLKDLDPGKKYDVILVDDTSARIPALALKKILEKIYNKKIEIYFLSVQDYSEKDFEKLSQKIKNKKVLFFTENTFSGITMAKVINFLTKLNVDFDVSSLFYSKDSFKSKKHFEDYFRKIFPNFKGNFLLGKLTSEVPLITFNHLKPFIGVVKTHEGIKIIEKLDKKGLKYYLSLLDAEGIKEIFKEGEEIKIENLDKTTIAKLRELIRKEVDLLVEKILEKYKKSYFSTWERN